MTKRILAGLVAAVSVMSLAACGDKDDSKAPAVELTPNQKLVVSDAANQLPEKELANKTITWMAHYNINPEDGMVESPNIFLFEEKYGGTIDYVSTTWDAKFTDLSSRILGNNSPDFFPADDMDTFPRGAISNMFQPIDDYVDLDSDLWADTKEVSDLFSTSKGHYAAVIDVTPNLINIYNRKTIEEMGYDDPAELYAEGKWDWDSFRQMSVDFVNEDEQKYALDGWGFENAIMLSSGKSLVTMENGKIVSNLMDPQIEKVQNFMYDLQKNSVAFPRHLINNWSIRGDGGVGIGTGLTLFWPSGIWELQNTVEKTKNFGDMEAGEIMFVPMPKDPASDHYYQASRIHGYNLVQGAKNPEGVGAFLDCSKVAASDESIKQITIDTLRDEYKWSEDMLDMYQNVIQLAKDYPVLEFYGGVSEAVAKDFDQVSRGTMIPGEKSWTEMRAEYQESIAYRINQANNELG